MPVPSWSLLLARESAGAAGMPRFVGALPIVLWVGADQPQLARAARDPAGHGVVGVALGGDIVGHGRGHGQLPHVHRHAVRAD
jgi:hypothetical protein